LNFIVRSPFFYAVPPWKNPRPGVGRITIPLDTQTAVPLTKEAAPQQAMTQETTSSVPARRLPDCRFRTFAQELYTNQR